MYYTEEYGLIAFRSRQHAIHFTDVLKMAGCPVQIVSTPRGISQGCGLSVKFSLHLTAKVMAIYDRYRYPITGFYQIEHRGTQTIIKRIPYPK
ncbi:MAG: DUF3343 domain-containing protein [Clostridiales bacterium]|jgi:hypothetical protein|nr:DUF3343 domain-containing protein [Clostridiales bacterium]